MDYESKAKELREAIFNHAEQGHGGPCLRSGPLDKMLEEWLRSTFPPQAPSYDYGFRVAMHPPQAPSYGYQIGDDPKARAPAGVTHTPGRWGSILAVDQTGQGNHIVKTLPQAPTMTWDANLDVTDWAPDPSTGTARLDTMQTVYPDPLPSDPKPGDIYIDYAHIRYEWSGKGFGWTQLKDRN
jgi:hypothetical protein